MRGPRPRLPSYSPSPICRFTTENRDRHLLGSRQEARIAVLRGAVGLTVVSVLTVVLWAILTKPARTSPSAAWQTALSLAEEGARKAIIELRREEGASPKSTEAGGSGESPAMQGDRTFLYWKPRSLGEMTGSCYFTVSEEGPAGLSINSTGILHDRYRTLAQRTLQVTARKRTFFESAVFAPKGLFVAAGAEIEHNGPNLKRAEDSFSLGLPTQEDAKRERLPLPLLPWGLPSKKPVVLSGGDVLTLSESGVFPMISLLDSSRLIIDRSAVLHVAGPLVLTGESRIVIPSHVADVSIYIDKDVTVQDGAGIVNLTQSASSLFIRGMEQRSRITLSTREPLYATVYAPNSHIRIGPGASLHGSVWGETVHVLEGTRLDYDEQLASLHSPLRPFAVVSCTER